MKIHRTINFTICEEGSEEIVDQVPLIAEIEFTPGSPETGKFGPPENYDPGTPHEFSVHRLSRLDGTGADAKHHEWVQRWIEINDEFLVQEVAQMQAASDALGDVP